MHVCLLQKNPLFAQETAKKLLSYLVTRGQFQKTSADPSRGALLFDSVEAEDRLDSAEFLRFLLRSIRIWATLFTEESGRNLNFFPKIYSILQKEGVVFPEDTIDLDQLSRETTRLEGAASQAQFSSVSDAWMNELLSKVTALEAEVRQLSRQAAQDYNEPLERAMAAVESYKAKKASKVFFTEQPGKSDWGGDLFRTEKMKAKHKEEEKQPRDSPNFDFDSENDEEEFEFNDNPSASDSPPFSPKKPASFSSINPTNPPPIKKAGSQTASMEFEFDDWQTPDAFTTSAIPTTQEIKRPELTRDSSVELERLKATLNAKEKEAASLRDANKSLLEEESRYKTTLKALQAEAQREATAAKDFQRQLSEKEAVLQDLRSQVQRLQMEGKTAKRNAEEAELRAAGLQTRLEVTEQNAALKLAELRKTYESSQKRLQEQVDDLEKKLLKANKAVEAKTSSRSRSKLMSRHSSSEEAEGGSERIAHEQVSLPQPRSDLRKTNPFEEPSLRPSMPTIARDVNERWFQASLTANKGVLYEDPGLKFDFEVKYKENLVLMQVLIHAKVQVRIEEMKVVEGISGTKQAGWLFRRYEISIFPCLSRPYREY